ncbi:MAG: cytochrome c1 [Panacagrimonas sp.]
MMQRAINLFVGLALMLGVTAQASAAGGGAVPFHFDPDPGNKASLQRGARNYMAYCSGCHSMQYLRYNRIAKDLEIPEEMLVENLMITTDKTGDTILSAMPAAQAAEWFGQAPPDLTLETRARGPSWVYSYLKTFYLDPSRPLGVNNMVLAGASMPHVLWELQGWQVLDDHADDAHGDDHGGGHGAHAGPPLKIVQEGSMTPDEYDAFVGDLVNFMAYAAEPGKADRIGLGFKAMAYLFILLMLAYLLKREFWKDLH